MDRRKIFLAAIGVILVAGFLLRLFPVRGGYHYWDEAVYLQHAEILTGESPDVYNEFEFRPPLFSLILAGSFLISSSLLSAHLTVAGLSSLAIILVYIVGKELYSRQTAIIAAAIYATSPLGIILSHDILVDPILPIFWLLTAFSLIKALRTDKRTYFVLTGLTAALAVLMKFTSLVIIPAVALVVSFSYFKETDFDINSILNKIKGFVVSDRNWLMASGFFIGILPYLLWSYLEFGSALHVFMTGWAKSGARDAFMTYINGWNKYILAPFYVGVFLFFQKVDLKKMENYLPIIFFISMYLPLQFFVANKETRFLMPAIPFIVLMAAEGLRKLRTGDIFENMKLSKSVFAFLILTSVLILPASMPERNVFAQGFSSEWEAPVMDAGKWLNQNTDEDAIVYTNYQYPSVGYYSKRNIVWFREYVPLDQIVGDEISQSGYVYYSRDSPYPHPSLNELETDPRFELVQTFENTVYLFYFTGGSQ
jgi:4-amino-4-deoxy-L-arabinose transferase-like glycosyltransferase